MTTKEIAEPILVLSEPRLNTLNEVAHLMRLSSERKIAIVDPIKTTETPLEMEASTTIESTLALAGKNKAQIKKSLRNMSVKDRVGYRVLQIANELAKRAWAEHYAKRANKKRSARR